METPNQQIGDLLEPSKALLEIGLHPLTWAQLNDIYRDKVILSLAREASEKVAQCHDYLLQKIANGKELIYGVNTGFGDNCDEEVPLDKLNALQVNLLRSHAAGVGPCVSKKTIKLMLALKVKSLALGHSGVKVETIQALIALYNSDIVPFVPTKGSLGASGDLAPLAHLALPLIGEGEVIMNGEKYGTSQIDLPFAPLQLGPKEGLALLNGTQFMLAYGIALVLEAERLTSWLNYTAALSADVWLCRQEAFHPLVSSVRKQPGHLEISQSLIQLQEGSELQNLPRPSVQDPYSFRCIPQVHGACINGIAMAKGVFGIEVESVTDNPLIFPEEDLILSGANFHGEPLALSLDGLALAIHELGSISERRTFNLLSGKRALPKFLAEDPGVQSGLMIAQYTAAALVSENKTLCHPASADTITSSNGQEDHVSMGAWGAVKAWSVLENVKKVIAIEWITALKALHFRKEKTSPALENIIQMFLEHFENLTHDLNYPVPYWLGAINPETRGDDSKLNKVHEYQDFSPGPIIEACVKVMNAH